MEASDIWNVAMTLTISQPKAEPRDDNQLLEKVCMEGAQLTEKEQAKLEPCWECMPKPYYIVSQDPDRGCSVSTKEVLTYSTHPISGG